MDEKAKEMLARIETELAALREKFDALAAEVALCRAAAEKAEAPEAVPEAPVPLETPAPVDLSDVVDLPDLPEDLTETSAVDALAETPVEAPAAEAPVAEVPAAEAAPSRELRRLSGEYRWQKDRPGAPVRNIRSGISLYDRALFINILFQEDFSRYDETIAALNACEGLDEAVDYLLGAFPDWNWNSDAVYAFMMSIRKKLG